MCKLLTISTASVALFGAVSVMAADSTVTYDIQPTCEVQDLDAITLAASSLDDPNLSRNSSAELFTLICDDPNGARITLTTTNGGLQSTGDPTLLVNYVVTLRLIASGTQLFTDGTPFAEVTVDFPPLADLVNPRGINAELFVLASFDFSGVYTDTLSINITGN